MKYLILLLFILPFSLFAQADYEKGKIFVQLAPVSNSQATNGQEIEAIAKKYGISRVYSPFSPLKIEKLKGKEIIEKLHHTFVWECEEKTDLDALIQELANRKEVVYAEKIPLIKIDYTPNDPNLALQWNLAKIDAANAWNIGTGGNKIRVAVVDDAVRITHQDLLPNVWNNTFETPGNGIDDDNNGYIDDINGWDVADNDNNPNPPAASATNSVFTHGTHCAGIVAAATDNTIGIASIGFNIDIMAVKTLSDATPGPYLTNPYAGVTYAIAAGAHVISMSWGGSSFSATYQTLFDLAYTNDIVCVAAAGNSNTNLPMYPASYNHIISVAATDNTDTKASFSNYGPQIDVSAPGVNIYSTLAGSTSSYGNLSGTSMACPLVAGLAGLMRSYNIGASADNIEICLKSTTDNIYPQNLSFIGQLGTGRINAYKAMLCMSGPPTALFSVNYQQICAGTSVQFTDESYPTISTWSWSFPGGTPSTSTLQNPIVTYNTNGNYPVTLIVSNPQGIDTLTIANYIQVGQPTAILSGGGFVNAGNPAFLQVAFTGTPPFSFVYFDGANNIPVNGVTANPYQFVVNPLTTTAYTLVSMQSAQCAGTVADTALVTVSTSCGLTINFQNILGGESQDIPRTVEQTPDCGYIVGGYTYSFGEGLYDAFLAKVDQLGQLSWFKTYGDSAANTHFHDIKTVSNGYIAVGAWGGQNYASHSLVVKTDLSGNVQWKQELECISGGGAIFSVWLDVKEDNNGDVILTGYVGHNTSFNSSGQTIIKLNGTNGAVIWFNTFQVNDYEHASRFRFTPGQGHIMVGDSRSWGATNGLFDFALTKTDASGAVIWSKNYGGIGNDYGSDVELTPDGGYIMVGNTENFGSGISDIMIIKTDSFGTINWAKRYGGALREVGIEIQVDCNNGYWVTGTMRSDSAQNEALIFKIDATGNVLWAKTIGGVFNDGENIGLTATGDCGAAFTFNTQSFGEGIDDIWLVKTDSLGNMDCHSKTINLATQNINPVAITANLGLINTYTITSTTIIENTATPLSPDSICTACGVPLVEFDLIINVMDVALVNHSLNTNAYSWFFGDGSTDTMKNAVHEYLLPGTYTVTLIAYNACASDTFSRQVTITAATTCTHRMQPGPITGKDASVFSRDDAMSANDGGGAYIWMDYWTWNGNPGAHRGFIEFDLTNICNSATLLDGNMTFYYDPALGNQQLGQNEMWVQLSGGNWDEYALTWNNQPASIVAGAVPVPVMSGNVNLNNLNLTPLIQQQIAGPNNGFIYQLQVEQTYRRNVFCTSDHADPSLRPVLELTFDPVFAYTSIPGHTGKSVTICKGDSIQLSVAGYGTANQTSGPSIAQHYLWIPSTGLDCDTCPNPKASPTKNITYKAIVYNCPSCADIDTLQVNISQVVAEHDTTICVGGSVQLVANIAGVSWANYLWSPSAGLNNPLIANPIASPAISTDYIVYATDSIGCNSQDTVKVSVSPYPILPIMRADSSFCVAPNSTGTINLPLTFPTNPISDYYYEWQPATVSPDPNSPNGLGLVNLTSNTTQTYHLTITSSDGCKSEDSITFYLGTCYAIAQNFTICKGDTAWVGTTPYTVAGTFVDSLISIGGFDSTITTTIIVLPTSASVQNISLCLGENYSINNHTYNTAGIYKDTLTNSWGCDSIITTNLTVHPLPIASVSNNSPVCEGQKLTLSASGGNTYKWSGPNNYSTSNPNPTISGYAKPTMSGIYKLVLSNAFGCKDSAQTNVLVYPKPDLQKDAIIPASCGLANGSISITPFGGTPSYVFSWKPNVGVAVAQANNLFGGQYTISIFDQNNCQDSLKLIVPNQPAPEALFTSNPLSNEPLIFEDTPIQFTNQSQNAISYLWNLGDNTSSVLTNPMHTYYNTGDFTVTLIAYDIHLACPDTFSQIYHLLPHGNIFAPNVFTPNADGNNDFFLFIGEGVIEMEAILYDRWGIEITRLNSLADKWDGKVKGIEAPEGTYTYKLFARFQDGRALHRAGTVILIR